MKKFMLLLTLFLVVVLSFGCISYNQNNAYESIRYGVILPLSGENSKMGKEALNALQLGVEKCNNNGGINERKIELFIVNNSSDVNKIAPLFADMIENKNVVGVLGGYTSNEALKMQELANLYKVPYISAIATNDEIGKYEESYSFRTCMTDSQQAAAMAYYLFYRQRVRTLGVMLDNSSTYLYTRSLAHKSGQYFAELASSHVLLEIYSSENKDFSKQIQKFIDNECEAIIMPSYFDDTVAFVKQARKMGFYGIIGAFDSIDSELLYEDDFNYGKLFYTSNYFYQNQSRFNQKFVEDFKAKYNYIPSNIEAVHYDAINMLMKATLDVYTPDMITFNLRNHKLYQSVCGRGILNSKNRLLHPVYILEKGGKSPELLEQIEGSAFTKFDDFK